MGKPVFCICENKDADQLRGVYAQLIRAFIFATWIVQSFLNPTFQASSCLLWLYSPICVGPHPKPQTRFSHDKAHISSNTLVISSTVFVY